MFVRAVTLYESNAGIVLWNTMMLQPLPLVTIINSAEVPAQIGSKLALGAVDDAVFSLDKIPYILLAIKVNNDLIEFAASLKIDYQILATHTLCVMSKDLMRL
jgi:hypothetical protein